MANQKVFEVGEYISVKIEACLPEIFVVSFNHDNKIYQGILLQSNKGRYTPGILSDQADPDFPDVPYFTLEQRHFYSKGNIKPVVINKKSKKSRMTVQLRPRQILCTKCQSACNENSKTVGPLSTIGKSLQNGNKKLKEKSVSLSPKSEVHSSSPSLVPKLIKLKASEIKTATKCSISSTNSSDSSIEDVELNVINSDPNMFDTDTTNLKSKCASMSIRGDESSVKRKGRIPKMTINTSTSINKKGESNYQTKPCRPIKTRSQGSLEEAYIDSHLPIKHSNIIQDNAFSCSEAMNKTFPDKFNDNLGTTLTEKSAKPRSPPLNSAGKIISNLDFCLSLTVNESKDSQISLQNSSKTSKLDKMILRKKRSIRLVEDLCEQNIPGEDKKIRIDKDAATKTMISISNEESVIPLQVPDINEKPKTTPVLKISFGPGKGTVLKIPAKSTIETEPPPTKPLLILSKAARKALKRARKEAQKKAAFPASLLTKFSGKSSLQIGLGGISPARLSSFSPGRFGANSPVRFGGTSPGRFGGASPARFNSTSAILLSPRASVDCLIRVPSRKHKHKMKHKKKHKENRKHKSSDENKEPLSVLSSNFNSTSSPTFDSADTGTGITVIKKLNSPERKLCDQSDWKVPISPPGHSYLQNSRHKLSISIKRVNNASYIACDSNMETRSETDVKLSSAQSLEEGELCSLRDKIPFTEMTKPVIGSHLNSLNISNDQDYSSDSCQSSDESGEVPNFPHIVTDCSLIDNLESDSSGTFSKPTWHDVDSCVFGNETLKVGDVVWGKINEFPLWPAKITCLKISQNHDRISWQAEVNWYGSFISSLVPVQTLQPFMKNFNRVYKKHKKGLYQDAVRQANVEGNFESANKVLQRCESPISSSPREVDVAS